MIQLPDFVVDLFDPAGRYLRDGMPRPRRRGMPRGFAEYKPIDQKNRRANARAQRHRAMAIEALRADVALPIPVDRAAISVAAAALAAHGRARIGVGNARLVRFWHGNAILEYAHPGGLRRTQISRLVLRDRHALETELGKHLASMLG